MNNEDGNPVNLAASAIAEATFDSDSPNDSDASRDSWWLRWIKFVCVIIVPALILGGGFVFEDYIEQYRADSSYNRNVAHNAVKHDTIGAMKFRFGLGACLGGALGAIYVGRCIARKTDP